MKTTIDNPGIHHNSRTTVGAIILVLGGLLLIDQLNLSFVPDWLISWPLIFVGIGIYSGIKHNFQNNSWFLFILLGIIFTMENSGLFIDNVIWPVALIAFGVYIIYKRSYGHKDLQQKV